MKRRASNIIMPMLNFLFTVTTTLLIKIINPSNAQTVLCNFCTNGITNPTLSFTNTGDLTCADVPFLLPVSGGGDDLSEEDCESFQKLEAVCCPNKDILSLDDICTFCEDGVTNPSLMVPEESEEQTTCAVAQVYASGLTRDDELCAMVKLEEGACCPPSTQLPADANDGTTLSPTPDSETGEIMATMATPTPPTEITSGNLFDIPATTTTGTGTISGIAFHDANNNGNIEDVTEYGVWDVKPSLYSCGDDDDTTIVATTSTSTQGTFQFENLAAGVYYIKYEYPSYYFLGSVWNGDYSTPNVDNSVNPANSLTNCFTLGEGDRYETYIGLTFFADPPTTTTATTPPPTVVATPPPNIFISSTSSPTEMVTIATGPPSIVPPSVPVITQSPTILSDVVATSSPTIQSLLVTSSPTAQSLSNTVQCSFCKGGIPDLSFPLPSGETCGSIKEAAAEEIDGSVICNMFQQEEILCCPDETPITTTLSPSNAPMLSPIMSQMILPTAYPTRYTPPDLVSSNKCEFCPEGIPDPSIMVDPSITVIGGQFCGSIEDAIASVSGDSELCLTIQASQSECCPSPTLMPSSAPTSSPSLLTVQPSVQPSGISFDLGLDYDLFGPVTREGQIMNLDGITRTESFRKWQTQTADFIMDYFKKNPENVYDVDVKISMVFETVTDIPIGTYTGNPGVQRPNKRRQLQSINNVRITFNQVTTFRSKDPEIYDEIYVAEEPFRADPEGYIALLKASSTKAHYDPVTVVQVIAVPPTLPPTLQPTAFVFVDVHKNFFEENMLYIIIGGVCGGVLIVAAVCMLIICRRRRRRRHNDGTVMTAVECDVDWQSECVLNASVSTGGIAVAGTVPSTSNSQVGLSSGETIVHVFAPEGKIGIVVNTPPLGGPAYVIDVKVDSPLFNRVHLGDKIIAVDDEDVQQLSHLDVSKLLARKSRNPQRKLTILREGDQRGTLPLHGNNLPLVEDSASPDITDTDNDDAAVTIIAPMGKLGFVVENNGDGGPAFVSEIQKGSVLEGEIQLFDRIIFVDDQDVRELKAYHISKLLAMKSRNLERKIVVLRETIGVSQDRFIV